jgi:hypothetical protein
MAKYSLLKNKETQERFARINKTGEEVFETSDPVRYADIRKKALAALKRAQNLLGVDK